jgi:transposase
MASVQYTAGMTVKPYPTDLTDAEWECIKELIPLPKPGGRHRELDIRAGVHAIFYVVDRGIKWRMLPHEYPQWPRVCWYCSQWRDRGDWQRMHDTLCAQVRQQEGATNIPQPAASIVKVSRRQHWVGNVATIAERRSKGANGTS